MKFYLKEFYWALPVVIIYFLGSFFQYFGLVTLTQTNMIVIFIASILILISGKAKHLLQEKMLVLLGFYIICISPLHESPFKDTLIYVYYLVCMMFTLVLAKICANLFFDRYSLDKYFYILKLFLFVQVVVTTLQSVFAEQFTLYSNASIGVIDAVSGTLFLQSDATLGFICLLALISTFTLTTTNLNRSLVALMVYIIIHNGNSLVSTYLLYFITLLFLFSSFMSKYLKVSWAFILSFIIVFIIFFTMFYEFELLYFTQDFFGDLYEDYDRRHLEKTAGRFAPIGGAILEGVSFFGSGALTYYNPLTKIWDYNSGFSTFYSLYVDFGLVAIILFTLYWWMLIKKNTAKLYYALIIYICFLSYSSLNFSITDLAAIFFVGFLLHAQSVVNLKS